jgi:ribosomal protein S18 acetylase RimI-like enzyme
MDTINIRKATHEDLEQLLIFEQGVITAERPFDTTLKPDPINYYDLKTMLTASHVYLVAAELDSKIIASGYARIEESKAYVKHEQYAYLGFMYVLPEHRGKGINKLIIDELKTWTASQGLTEIRLDVYYENESAIKAYEKIGFKKHMIEMRFNMND